jgi:hypothetical protein
MSPSSGTPDGVPLTSLPQKPFHCAGAAKTSLVGRYQPAQSDPPTIHSPIFVVLETTSFPVRLLLPPHVAPDPGEKNSPPESIPTPPQCLPISAGSEKSIRAIIKVEGRSTRISQPQHAVPPGLGPQLRGEWRQVSARRFDDVPIKFHAEFSFLFFHAEA